MILRRFLYKIWPQNPKNIPHYFRWKLLPTCFHMFSCFPQWLLDAKTPFASSYDKLSAKSWELFTSLSLSWKNRSCFGQKSLEKTIQSQSYLKLQIQEQSYEVPIRFGNVQEYSSWFRTIEMESASETRSRTWKAWAWAWAWAWTTVKTQRPKDHFWWVLVFSQSESVLFWKVPGRVPLCLSDA